MTRQYFVYCKENQRSMAEKEPPLGHIDIFQTWPRSIGLLSPDPYYGSYPLSQAKISGAQNLSGFLRFLPGHWALGFWKIGVGAIPQPRLTLTGQHAWFETRDTSSAPFGGTFP